MRIYKLHTWNKYVYFNKNLYFSVELYKCCCCTFHAKATEFDTSFQQLFITNINLFSTSNSLKLGLHSVPFSNAELRILKYIRQVHKKSISFSMAPEWQMSQSCSSTSKFLNLPVLIFRGRIPCLNSVKVI